LLLFSGRVINAPFFFGFARICLAKTNRIAMNNNKRNVLVTMLIASTMIHVLLGALWSATRLYSAQNLAASTSQDFTVLKMPSSDRVEVPRMARSLEPAGVVVLPLPNDTATESPVRGPITTPSATPPSQAKRQSSVADVPANAPMGPFVSAIDPKKAWINVAESVNYNVLRGISMDVSQGKYLLPDELDVRVRAKGDLVIEYPFIAAALGKEALVYVLLLIDEQGTKTRVEIARGDADFDQAVLHALEKIEFRPAMLKRMPVRSLLLLEFDFRREAPRPSPL
jgi:TonB family protein